MFNVIRASKGTSLRPVHTIRFQGSDSWFRKLDSGVLTVRFQGSVFVCACHLSRRVSDENRACPVSIRFSKLRIRVSEVHLYCVHTIRFSEPTKIGSLKSDRVSGPFHGLITAIHRSKTRNFVQWGPGVAGISIPDSTLFKFAPQPI